MTLTLNGTSGVTTPGISNSEGYTGDGLTIAAGAPAGAMTLDASGNLGVGTSSPAYPLTVSGADRAKIHLNNTNTGGGSWILGATDNIWSASGGKFVITSDGGSNGIKFAIDSSGNVGIGTSSPTNKLHVYGGNGAAYIKVDASDTTLTGKFQARTGTATMEFGSVSNSPLVFVTNDTERMRIDPSGNLSITQSVGKNTVDVTSGATYIANGGTIDFASSSGMLLVNCHGNGHIGIWLCGGGLTTQISAAGASIGTCTYIPAINGYRWTNNTGFNETFGMFFVRTRTGA